MSHFNNNVSSKLTYRPYILVCAFAVALVFWVISAIQLVITCINLVGVGPSGGLFTDVMAYALWLVIFASVAGLATYIYYLQADARQLVVDDVRTIEKLLNGSAFCEVLFPSGRSVRLWRLDDGFKLSIEDANYISGDFIFEGLSVTASYEGAFRSDQINRVEDIFVELRKVLKKERP